MSNDFNSRISITIETEDDIDDIEYIININNNVSYDVVSVSGGIDGLSYTLDNDVLKISGIPTTPNVSVSGDMDGLEYSFDDEILQVSGIPICSGLSFDGCIDGLTYNFDNEEFEISGISVGDKDE